MFVIKCDGKFFGIDQSSSGYACWNNNLLGATLFHTLADAENIFNSANLDDSKTEKMSGGTIYPTRMIQSGLGLNLSKREGRGTITIEEIEFTVVRHKSISAKIIYSKE